MVRLPVSTRALCAIFTSGPRTVIDPRVMGRSCDSRRSRSGCRSGRTAATIDLRTRLLPGAALGDRVPEGA